MIGTRLARVIAPFLATALASSCIFAPDTAKPTPTPTPKVSLVATRPRLELSTYQYALQTKGKIRVAVRENSRPLSVRSGSAYDGFEADVAREIARAIWGTNDDPDTHIQWIPVDDSMRIAALTSNQADIAIAGLTISDDNRKVIDLTDGYYKDGQRLLVKKSNDQIKDLVDVSGGDQTVCAIKGSTWDQSLRVATNDRAKILELDTLDFCVQALRSGAADAVTQDEAVLLGLVFRDPDVKIVAKPITDDLVGVGIKKNVSADRQGFRDFINTTLLTIVANRTWAKLYQKHITPLSGDTKQLPTD